MPRRVGRVGLSGPRDRGHRVWALQRAQGGLVSSGGSAQFSPGLRRHDNTAGTGWIRRVASQKVVEQGRLCRDGAREWLKSRKAR